MVRGHEEIVESLTLPDPNDRHVLAAAIRGGAEAIVTANLADFPAETLSGYQIEPKHPDAFVLELIESAPAKVVETVTRQAADLRSPRRSAWELLNTLEAVGIRTSVARLQELLDSGPAM